MKRTMLLFGIVSMLTIGAAFAGENQAASAIGGRPYNGITYFDLRPASAGRDSTPLQQPATKLFNGITAFDLEQPGSIARVAAGDIPATVKMSSVFNGITVF